MSALARFAFLLVFGGAAAPSCAPALDDGDCTNLCRQADACGLLHSPLGTDIDNCKSRCALSNDASSASSSILSCWKQAEQVSSDSAPPWCASNDRCESFARCLSHDLPEAGTLGRGTARLVLTAPSLSPELADGALCASSMEERAFAAPSAFCTELGASHVTAVLRVWTGQLLSRGPSSCEAALAGGIFFDGVPPGLSVPGLRIVGALPMSATADAAADPDLDAGPDAARGPTAKPYCVYAWGTSNGAGGVVAAGETPSKLLVAPPTASEIARGGDRWHVVPCEQDPIVCRDGEDNDRDTLTDCADPKCAPFCRIELCTGGVDEDMDMLIDCADPDCFPNPECVRDASAPEGGTTPADAGQD